MPGHIGLWLALTGARIKAADCELIGVATDFVESAQIAELKAAIVADPAAHRGAADRVRGRRRSPAAGPAPGRDRHDCSRPTALEAIIAALEAAGTDWAREQLKVMATKSPQTMKVAFRQLQLGGKARILRREHGDGIPDRRPRRAAPRLPGGRPRGDRREGQRAAGGTRRRPEDVSEAMLDAIFAPFLPTEEWSPLP